VIELTPGEPSEELKTKMKEVVVDQLKDLKITEFEKNVDKCHRLGPERDGKQASIIRFSTHTFHEKIYSRRKKLSKKVKFKVSLTKRRTELLKFGNEISSSVDAVQFAFADPMGNLRVLLKNPIKNRKTIPYESKKDLLFKVANLGVKIPEDLYDGV